MLADWFFCTTMRLSPADAHAYLDTLAVLRRSQPELQHVLDSAAALRSAPSWLQLYALHPLLTAHGKLADGDAAGADDQDGSEPMSGSTERTAGRGDGQAYGDAELGRRAGSLCKAILASTDHPLAARLESLLAAVVRDEEGARAYLLKDVTRPLAEESRQLISTVGGSPYHDLNDQIMPTLAVIALAELSRRRPTSATQDWLGDGADPLAAAALRGEHGRLALLVAVEAAGRADPHAREEIWRNLWHEGHGAPHMQPDLLDALARLWFGYPDSEAPPAVAELEAEASTGDDLALWSSVLPPDSATTAEFYALLTGHSNGAWEAMTAVLWQSVLWSLAAEVDQAETATRLARWWQAPRRRAGEPSLVHVGRASTSAVAHLKALQRLSWIPPKARIEIDDAPIEETSAEVGSRVLSPWMDRWHDGWDHGRKRKPAFNAGPSGIAEPLLRVTAAGSLSVRLLSALPDVGPQHDHLTALVFHTFDVLRDQAELLTALELGEYTGEHPLGPALTSLVWHVNTTLQDAGTGADASIDPAVFADFAARMLEDGATADLDDGEQFARLARQPIGAICTMWIGRAWLKSSALRPAEGPGRWFLGDPPRALRVLMAAVDRLSMLEQQRRELKNLESRRRREMQRQEAEYRKKGLTYRPQSSPASPTRGLWTPDIMTPAQLLRELYPSEWPQPVADRWPQLDLDWHAQREKLREHYEAFLRKANGEPEEVKINTVRSERLLLSPRYPLEVWRECAADLENWTRIGGEPITMRTLRLAALLRDPAAADSVETDYREWVEDWLDRMYALTQGSRPSPDVQAIMLRLLALERPGSGIAYQRLLSSVFEATVDVILEFGGSTPRHVETLLERLAGDLVLGREATDRLRLRALETIYRQRLYRGARTNLSSATGLHRSRVAAAARERAILQYLDDIAAPEEDWSERTPLFERARELWQRTQVRPMLLGRRVPLVDRRRERGERPPELLIAATVTDRFRAEEISYLIDAISPAESRPEHGPRLHNLFPSPQYRQRVIEDMAGRERIAYAVVAAVEDGNVWLNAGLGTPLAYAAASTGADLAPGDVVAARLRGKPAAVVGIQLLQRPGPEPNETRTATVRTDGPWLRVKVDGVPGQAYPRGEGPVAEAVRRLWDPDLSRTLVPADDQTSTLPVRWDDDLRHWVPVERSFSELIIDEPQPLHNVRLTHAGGDLFVTRPGRLYRLKASDWQDPGTVAALTEGQTGGLTVRVSRADTREPLLRLDASDDGNIRWLRLFSEAEQEFTVATKGERGYTITVDPPEGFPGTVAVRGAEGGHRRAYVIIAPWSDRQARLREVAVTLAPVSGMKDPQDPTPERFEEVFSMAEGQPVTLQRIFSNNRENYFVWATTSTEIAVRLETDSLTLLDPHAVDKTANRLVRGRACEVVRIYRRPVNGEDGRPMSVAELAERVHTTDASADSVRRLTAFAQTVEGVVVARAALTGHSETTMYGTWCRFGDQIHYVELDQEALGGSFAQLVGQTFSGDRTGDLWSFRFVPREITVRALFNLVDGQNDDGRAAFVGTDGSSDFYQDPARPVLVRRPGSGDDAVRRFELGAADVSLIDRRNMTARTVVVKTRETNAQNRRVALGSTTFQGDVSDAQVRDMRLRIFSSRAGLPGLVQVRRTFVLSARTVTRTRSDQRIDYAMRWSRFLNSGQDHVTGTIIKTRTHIEISGGLRVPGPDGRLSARLPLRRGEEPSVAGVPYRSLGARVRLFPHDDGYLASYSLAEPKTVPEFMRLMNQEVTVDGVARDFADPLYYVSPPTAELDAHLFEWGYGWTVAVSADRLRVAGSPEGAGLPPLFHGDRIKAAAFVAAEDGGDPVMVIAWQDVHARYVRQIVEERRRRYLHLLEVELSGGTLRVIRAQAGRQRGDDPFRSAEWVPFPAALDPESTELVLRRLSESGLARGRILARLDADTAISTGGRQLFFRAVQAEGGGLEERDYVFLTARKIEETSNELTVVFGIPDALNTEDLVVRVNRREFSFRESTLARLRARGLVVDNAEVVMLVRLMALDHHGVRHGSVKDAPPREPETLVSYLANRGGASYAVFGGNRLEIAPGVIFSAEGVVGAMDAQHGAVVRLVLDAARRIVMTTALPADRSYIGAQGRAIVVFPKSSLLRRRRAGQDTDMSRGFVPSGLPDVQASPAHDAGATVLATPHPKTCWIWRPRSGGFLLRPARPTDTRLARLMRPDPAQPAAVVPRVLPGEARGHRDTVSVPWARMSFRNASAREIARAGAAYRWQHHDRTTGHVESGRLVGPYEVKPGSAGFDGVFFDDDSGWTLRYRPGSLSAFGFPADELLDSIDKETGFAVAGPSRDGLGVWVELGPGKIVEIRGALVTSEGRSALTMLDWAAFSPGDEIGLRPAELAQRTRGWETSQGSLTLASWRPSVTSALPRDDPDARILLPVRRVDMEKGALRLADRRSELVYPMARSSLTEIRGADAVWVNARNDIEPYTAGSLRPGDTVLLGADQDGRLMLRGVSGVEVRIAALTEYNWPGCDWLARGLANEDRAAALLAVFDQQLPVTVSTIGVDRPVVTVCRNRQSSGRWPLGRQVWTEVLAATERQLFLRSGGAVRTVPFSDAVSGVPAELRGEAAAAMSQAARSRPFVLWWSISKEGGRRAGLTGPGDAHSTQDLVVVPEIEVAVDGSAVGVICRDVATARLHWLPAKEATWAGDVAARDLLANLELAGRLAVRLQADGSLSIIGRPAVSHQLGRLHLGQPLRVVLGAGRPQPMPDGHWRYIARLEVPPVLLAYLSADPNLTAGSSRLTEVDELSRTGRPIVTTVDVNTRRITLDLPKWALAAHQAIGEGRVDPAMERFGKYRLWYREGLGDSALPENPVEGILRLAGDLQEEGAVLDQETGLRAVARWMAEYGRPAFNLVRDTELDAAPLLAAAVVLDALAGTAEVGDNACVLLLRQLGRRAAASLHTEQIITSWIGRPDQHVLGGAWARLRELSLERELDPWNVRRLREFCRAMLTKPVLRTAESALAPVARSLLAAIGDLESASDLQRDAAILAGPALWARTLAPPAGHLTAQPSLLASQRAVLWGLAEHVINDAVPLTLMPVVAPPHRTERDLAHRILRNLQPESGDTRDRHRDSRGT